MNTNIQRKLLGTYVSAIIANSNHETEQVYTGTIRNVKDDFIELFDGISTHIALFAGVDQGIYEIIRKLPEQNENPRIYSNNSVTNTYKNGVLLDLEERTHVKVQKKFFL